MSAPTLYLASQSPRRLQLLEQIGITPSVLKPTDPAAAEALEAERPGETPVAYVRRVTRAKLAAATRQLAESGLAAAPVLCADTTVALGRRLLAKPVDAEDAAAMLRTLSGRTHRVLTAVAVHAGALREGAEVTQALSISHVRFAALTEAAIARYVESGEWRGKAGGYGIQGRAAAFVAHLAGSYSGVMGLPLYETAALLARAGIVI